MAVPLFVVGIAGGSSAGKTTMARLTTEDVGESVTRIPINNHYEDQNYLDTAEHEQADYDHPSAFEWDLLYKQLLELMEGRAVEVPQYDFGIHNRRSEHETVEPADVVILERTLALYDEDVNEMPDLRLYAETDADVRILRHIQRDAINYGHDLQGVIGQYLLTVKPMHKQLIEPAKKHANLITPEGANSVAITLPEEKVQVEIEGDEARTWEHDAIKREVQERASSRGSGN